MASGAVDDTEVLLVGAGPIGLELAVALKTGGVPYVHLEAGQLAQTITWYPRQARFFSSPDRIAISGVPLVTPDQSKATREQYLSYLRGVALQYGLEVRTFEAVEAIERDHLTGRFTVSSRAGEQTRKYLATFVVLAIGDMHHPRMLHIPGEELPWVSHHFDEPNMFFGKRLMIVGGRNSAVEAALRCHRIGARVSISYRRAAFDPAHVKYWLLPEIESMVRHGDIAFYPGTVPDRITAGQVHLVPAAGRGSGQPQGVDADFVLLLTGYEQDAGLFTRAGVELEGESNRPKLDPETMMTSVPNLFVAGTAVAGTQCKVRQFIENSHVHVTRIYRAITGREPAPGLVNDVGQRLGLIES